MANAYIYFSVKQTLSARRAVVVHRPFFSLRFLQRRILIFLLLITAEALCAPLRRWHTQQKRWQVFAAFFIVVFMAVEPKQTLVNSSARPAACAPLAMQKEYI